MQVLWRAARWLLLGVLLLAGLILLPFFRDEAARMVVTLAGANAVVLAIALVGVVTWIAGFGLLIRESAIVVGRRLSMRRTSLLAAALQFVYAFPAGGVAGLVYETRAVERMGVPRGTAMLIVGLETVVFHGTFLLFLLTGVLLLALQQEASRALVLGAAGLVAVVAGVAIAALYLLGDPVRAAGAHDRLQRLLGSGRGVASSIDEVALAVQRIRETPAMLVKPVVSALAMWSAVVLVLGLVFMAFAVPPNPGVVITAFSVGLFAGRVTPIPGGVGAIEGAMVATLSGLDVALAEALAITLAFRVLTFVLPAVCGFGAHHLLARIVDPELDRVVPVRGD